jgi:hypothetical protein
MRVIARPHDLHKLLAYLSQFEKAQDTKLVLQMTRAEYDLMRTSAVYTPDLKRTLTIYGVTVEVD